MFDSIQICSLDPVNTNPSNRILNKIYRKIAPNINFDFEENSPFQEGVMSETFQRLDKSCFQNPKELGDIIHKENLIYKYLPKQSDIDKILGVIKRKVLKGTHLPVEVKKFKQDIYATHILKIYICICYKISSQLQNQPLGN